MQNHSTRNFCPKVILKNDQCPILKLPVTKLYNIDIRSLNSHYKIDQKVDMKVRDIHTTEIIILTWKSLKEIFLLKLNPWIPIFI